MTHGPGSPALASGKVRVSGALRMLRATSACWLASMIPGVALVDHQWHGAVGQAAHLAAQRLQGGVHVHRAANLPGHGDHFHALHLERGFLQRAVDLGRDLQQVVLSHALIIDKRAGMSLPECQASSWSARRLNGLPLRPRA